MHITAVERGAAKFIAYSLLGAIYYMQLASTSGWPQAIGYWPQ